MSATVLYTPMSIDGLVTGPDVRPDNGLGDGGSRLHEWALPGGEVDLWCPGQTMTGELKDRVALVTGSSRGIGAAIASRFAAAGASVAVHGRDKAALTAVRSRIEDQGGRAIAVAADLTRADEVEAMAAQVERDLGPVDVLVANAGGSPVRPGPIENISPEDRRASVDANLTATFLTVKYVLPGMKQRGRGVIITMASAASRRPRPGGADRITGIVLDVAGGAVMV